MKLAKRLFALLLVVLTLFSFVPHASAASVNLNETAKENLPNWNNISIRSYALSTSGRITSFNDSSLRTRNSGWIDARTDECTIQKIANGGQALYIKFPIGGGKYISRWFASSEFIGTNLGQQFPVLMTTKQITTYRRYNGGSTYGYTGSGDKIYVIGVNGNYTGIVYPLTGGGYKLGYVKNSDIQNGTKIISDMVDVTSSFSGKQIKIRSVQNGKYLCADGGQNYTPAMCNRNNASTWETFTVSVTGDGWAGFKAYNGKWLSATNNVTNTPIRATGSNLLSWECFKIYKKGSDYYIKAQANSKWLCVRIDIAGAPVQSYAAVPSTWERFQIEVIGNKQEDLPEKDIYTIKVDEFLSRGEHKHGAAWGYYKRPSLSGFDSIGCCAYTADFVKYVFDKGSPRDGTVFYNVNDIRAGDVIILKDPHWFVVLERRSDGWLRVAEANVAGGKVRVSDNVYQIRNGVLYKWDSSASFSCGYHFK